MDVRRVLLYLIDYRVIFLFWFLVYLVVFLFVRRAVIFLETGRTRQGALPLLLCGGFFAVLAGLFFGGQPLIIRRLALLHPVFPTIFGTFFWDFVCFVWVVLDGVFVLYTVRIHRQLRRLRSPGEGAAAPPGRHQGLKTALLVVSLFALFLIYHARVLAVYEQHQLNQESLFTLSFIFLRLAGAFWVVFEGTFAVMTFRVYRLLKRIAA